MEAERWRLYYGALQRLAYKGRKRRGFGGLCRRRDGAPIAGAAAPHGTEDGGGRTAIRRNRSRFQQSPWGHHRLHSSYQTKSGSRTTLVRIRGGNRESWPARCVIDEAAFGIQPSTGPG